MPKTIFALGFLLYLAPKNIFDKENKFFDLGI